jgi:DNA mismatch repair protein MutL
MIKHLNSETILKIKSDISIPDIRQIIKELLENSLDAKATRVDITLIQNGIKSISIEDNGVGIPIDSRELACTRYCTSKFTDFAHGIPNFGFRGEALNSICIDCNGLEVFTKVADEPVGKVLSYDASGVLVKQISTQRTVGTRVTINNVFCLKPPKQQLTISTQTGQIPKIVEMLFEYSFSCLDVKFMLKNDDKILYSKPQFRDIPSAITNLYDLKVFSALKASLVESDAIKMNIYLPDAKSKDVVTGKQFSIFFFVNARPVDWPDAKKMIHKVFRTEFQRTDLFALIYLDLPNDTFQIANTNKKTVYFSESQVILRILETKLKEMYQTDPDPVLDNPTIRISYHNEKIKKVDEKQTRMDHFVAKKPSSETKDDSDFEDAAPKPKPTPSAQNLTPTVDSRPKPKLKDIQEYLIENTMKKNESLPRPILHDFEEKNHSLSTKREFSTHYVNKTKKIPEAIVEPVTPITPINNVIAKKMEVPKTVPIVPSKRKREEETNSEESSQVIDISLSEVLEAHLEVKEKTNSNSSDQGVEKYYRNQSLSQVDIDTKGIICGSFINGKDEYLVVKIQNSDSISLWCFEQMAFDISVTFKDLMKNFYLTPSSIKKPIDVTDLITRDHLWFKKLFKWNGLELVDSDGRIALKGVFDSIVGYGRKDVEDLCKLLETIMESFNHGTVSLREIEENFQDFRPPRVKEYLEGYAKSLVKKRSGIKEYQLLLEKISRKDYSIFHYLGSVKIN